MLPRWIETWIWAWLLGVMLGGCLHSMSPMYGMTRRAKRAEIPANVDRIKTAQLAYDAAFDRFIHQGRLHPRPVEAIDQRQVAWTAGTAFDTLGWVPDGKVRGSYAVLVREDARDFLVVGVSDTDGDSHRAVYFASKEVNATLIGDPDVH